MDVDLHTLKVMFIWIIAICQRRSRPNQDIDKSIATLSIIIYKPVLRADNIFDVYRMPSTDLTGSEWMEGETGLTVQGSCQLISLYSFLSFKKLPKYISKQI